MSSSTRSTRPALSFLAGLLTRLVTEGTTRTYTTLPTVYCDCTVCVHYTYCVVQYVCGGGVRRSSSVVVHYVLLRVSHLVTENSHYLQTGQLLQVAQEDGA